MKPAYQCSCLLFLTFDILCLTNLTVSFVTLGIPHGAVRQALQKEGKDPDVVDMDPEKSYASQIKGKESDGEKDDGTPLKDDPEYTKFFKVSPIVNVHPALSCLCLPSSSNLFMFH